MNFDHLAVLVNFFRLESDVCLTSLVDGWARCDPVFKEKANCNGIRLLRVDPLEAMISFICSANNNIGRITKMVNSLCSTYGQLVATIDDQSYYKFPTLESMHRRDCESVLRSHGFGYRAKYIHKCVQQVLERGGEEWLQSLKKRTYEGNNLYLHSLAGT